MCEPGQDVWGFTQDVLLHRPYLTFTLRHARTPLQRTHCKKTSRSGADSVSGSFVKIPGRRPVVSRLIQVTTASAKWLNAKSLAARSALQKCLCSAATRPVLRCRAATNSYLSLLFDVLIVFSVKCQKKVIISNSLFYSTFNIQYLACLLQK